MIHFLGEILLLILFTALLWFGIGWWVSSIERNKTLRSREEEWRHYLNTLRRDRDSFRDEVEKAHGRIRVLENRRADGQSPPQDPGLSAEEREQYERSIQELQEKFLITERKMLGFSQHVETLHSQNLEREQTLVQFKKKIAELTDTLHEREEALDKLSAEAAKRVNDASVNQSPAAVHDAIDDETIAHSKAAASANEVAVRRATLLEMTLAEKNREIEELQQSIEQSANAVASESHQQVVELKNLVREQEFSIAQLRDQVANADTSAQEEEIRNLHEAMAEQEDIISQLRSVLDKATRQTTRHTTRKSTPGPRVSPAIPATTPRSGDLFANPSQPNDPVLEVSNNPAANPPAKTPQFAQTALTSSSDQSSAATSGPDRKFAVSIKLFAEPPVNADDLKTINGIGPAFERTLNRLGIYQFGQIASLSREDIEWVARELNSFSERIVRDQWVAQAKALEGHESH